MKATPLHYNKQKWNRVWVQSGSVDSPGFIEWKSYSSAEHTYAHAYMLMELRLPHHTVGCQQMSTMQTLPTSLLSFLNITCVAVLCLLPVRISFARKNVYICHDMQKVMTALQGAMKLLYVSCCEDSGPLCHETAAIFSFLACDFFFHPTSMATHHTIIAWVFNVLSCQRLSDFLLCCHLCTVSPYRAIKNKTPPMMRKWMERINTAFIW